MPKNSDVKPRSPVVVLPGVVLCAHVSEDADGSLTLIGAKIGSIGIRAPYAPLTVRLVLPVICHQTGSFIVQVEAKVREEVLFTGDLEVEAMKGAVGRVITPPFELPLKIGSLLVFRYSVAEFPKAIMGIFPVTNGQEDEKPKGRTSRKSKQSEPSKKIGAIQKRSKSVVAEGGDTRSSRHRKSPK